VQSFCRLLVVFSGVFRGDQLATLGGPQGNTQKRVEKW